MATCTDADSFRLDSDDTWDGLLSFDGCYSDSGVTELGEIVYFRGGDKVDGEPAVRVAELYSAVSQGIQPRYPSSVCG